jgi:hypothetical protein
VLMRSVKELSSSVGIAIRPQFAPDGP